MTMHDGRRDDHAVETMDKAAARAFCTGLSETVDALIRVLDEETQLVRAARLNEAAALADDKAALFQQYGRAHGVVKESGGEIGRQAPVEVDHLRRRHQALEAAISNNLAVLVTARTVSETLIRSVAEALSPNVARPATYGSDARGNGSGMPTGPLSLNVAL